MADEITLVDPAGQECVVGTAEEANNLLCEGYQLKQPAARPRTAPESKTAEK